MKKSVLFSIAAILIISLVACGNTSEGNLSDDSIEGTTNASDTSEETKENATEITITYLGEEYTVPNPVENIVAASLEGMEDAAALGIKPVGVLEVAGEIPEYLAKDLEGATLIGDKTAPNAEVILTLDPDVIIGTSKWGEETMAQLNKIATTLPYSHISTNWKENLLTLGELAGKKDEAQQIIDDYEVKANEAKTSLANSADDKEVLVIRIRGGLMYIYSPDVYVNPILYEDLGLKVPEIVENAEQQQEITLETLSEVDPDVIFLQFEEAENLDAPSALDDLLENPVFSNLTASKNDEVYVNTIAPLAQGGTAWSKTRFLDAAVDKLVK
ncbi:ABC transporter substrate-binding protein [Fervidibacillus albus]|uniref:ABC transporter substrate-binding protein n=1 Tax=Fervidibacillus albus TaxID=2980026 RepID=A0A9E8RVP7_9BACI|nr:ABC transporter substrate-binding protein [Fervidibacillus albus]WAA09183.1 ABC transporter substrate-binding protein [Fervidibacillus albus]